MYYPSSLGFDAKTTLSETKNAEKNSLKLTNQ
jgi:hypothetical protein